MERITDIRDCQVREAAGDKKTTWFLLPELGSGTTAGVLSTDNILATDNITDNILLTENTRYAVRTAATQQTGAN